MLIGRRHGTRMINLTGKTGIPKRSERLWRCLLAHKAVLGRTVVASDISRKMFADLFNLFNHPNLNLPVNAAAVGTSGGNGDQIFLGRDARGNAIPAPNAGRIFQTVTTSRQIQFGLKMTF